jgi:hypothetical protein
VGSRAGSIGLAIAAVIVLAACTAGGGADASAGAASAVASGDASSPASPAAPSVAPSAATSVAPSVVPSAGTGSSSGPCALVTIEEVAQVTGVDVAAVESDARTCIYETPTSHAIVALVQRTTEGAAEMYAGLKSGAESFPVSGVGDEAIWQPAMEAVQLHVLQGDDLVSLAVGTLSGVPVDELTGMSPEALVDMATQLGKIAVGRL